jgi:hypothetical protein
MDEMARPAMDYTDSSGETKSYEPIANVPYFMGKVDINYLYQFPPSLWAEAFHYRINSVFREFIENLQQNEENKINGKPPLEWNDKRTVILKWKASSVNKEMKEQGIDSRVLKYQFSNIKTFISEYWDSLQRDIDTEFFAKNDDTPEARAEYEKILQKAMNNNADTGGFFGTSLRKMVQCDITTIVKKKIKGQEQEVHEKGTIWSCIGYRPITVEAVSDQIGNWIAASHHGWTSNHVDPTYKQGSELKQGPSAIPNKGSRNFDSKFVVNSNKLTSIRNQVANAGGSPFTVDSYGFVSWKNNVKKIVDYIRRNPDNTTSVVNSSVASIKLNDKSKYGMHGLEKLGRLPVLEPGYKIDSKSADSVDKLSKFTDFSELSREVLNKLLIASQEDFDQMSADIVKKSDTKAVKRLEAQLKKLIEVRDLLPAINNSSTLAALKTKTHEEEIAASDEKEKRKLKVKYALLQLLGNFKEWSEKKRKEIGSYKSEDFEDQFLKLKKQFQETLNTHYSYEASSHKGKSPSEEERTNISKNDMSRKGMLKQMEYAFNAYEFLLAGSSDKISASNVIPLLAIYLREIQSNAKKFDAFSYAIATHNNQRKDKTPLGLDMANPLEVGEKKYPGLSDKTRGFGTFEPNKSSKHRLNANQQQWTELKKFFGAAEVTEYPFSQDEIEKLMSAGRKYQGKVLDYISSRKDILEYLDLESNQIHTMSLNAIKEKVKKASSSSDKEQPEDLSLVIKELKNITDQLSNLSDMSRSGSIQSAIKEGIAYAIATRVSGDQVASAAKYDPSFPSSLEFAKDYIAKAAETYLMRASGAGPLMYWLSAYKDTKISPLQKLKIYLGAREEVKEIAKNYVYTLCQLPQDSNDTALALSRKRRKSFAGSTQTSQIGSSGGDSEFDFDDQIVQQMDANKMSVHSMMQSPSLVKVIKSSLFDNSDPTQSIETVIRNDFRKIMPQSHTFGIGVEKGTTLGQDVEEFTNFIAKAIASKVEKAQQDKNEKLQKLKDLDLDVDTKQDNDVLSTIGFASLLYSLMELEVDQQYGKELSGINDSKKREDVKNNYVKAAMKNWKEKNLGSKSGEKSIASPDLTDRTVANQINKSFNSIIEDQDEFNREEINVSNIPIQIRSPEVVNAIEVLAAVVKDLPKDENGEYDMRDLDREIAELDSGAGSPWENDANKEYKINVAMLCMGDNIKYKQAATAIEAPEEERVSPDQLKWIKDRTALLRNTKKAEPEVKPNEDKPFKHFPSPDKPMPTPSMAPVSPPTQPQATQPRQQPPAQPAKPVSDLAGFLNRRASLHKPSKDTEDDF